MEFRSQLMDRDLGSELYDILGERRPTRLALGYDPRLPGSLLALRRARRLVEVRTSSFSNATVISFVSLEKKSLMSGGSLH